MAAVEEDADTGAPAPKVVHCTSTLSASDSEVASAKSRVSWSACLPRSNSDSQIAFITVVESTGTGTETPVLRRMFSWRRISTCSTMPSMPLSSP